jgi:hypothetical protein
MIIIGEFDLNIKTMIDWIDLGPPRPGSWTLLGLITFSYKSFLFNYIIKIDAHKIEYQPKKKHLFETIIHRKQTRINNTVHFLTNSKLNDEIKKLITKN